MSVSEVGMSGGWGVRAVCGSAGGRGVGVACIGWAETSQAACSKPGFETWYESITVCTAAEMARL